MMLFLKRMANVLGFRRGLGLIIGMLILGPIGWHIYVHRAEIASSLIAVRVEMLFIAQVLAVLNLGILASVWLLIANRLEIALGPVRDLKAFFVSNFAKRAPGIMWYVVGRAYLYRTAGDGVWIATTGTVLENSLLLLAGILLALIVWPYQLGLDRTGIVIALPIVSLVIAVFSFKPTAILRFAHLFQDKRKTAPVRTLRLSALDILLWIALYALVWILGGFSFHFFLKAFCPSLSFAAIPFTLGVSTAYSISGLVAFFLPGGLGVKELTGAYLLSSLLPAPLAITIMLLFRVNLLLAESFWLGFICCLGRWMRSPTG